MTSGAVSVAGLVADVSAIRVGDRPVIVGIDGRSGVGKSTLARAIAAQTAATVIGGDDFFAGGTTLVDAPPEHLADLCIDRQKLLRVLEDLRSGRTAAWRAFDWEAFDGRLEVALTQAAPADVIIVEGVYSCHPDLRPVLDLRVLAKVAPDVREDRLKAREGEIGPWDRQWHAAEDWYFATLAPDTAFDRVVDTTDEYRL
ncbi:uridine kinase family protein [Brevundimonas fluminis]|uniref:uridine kinase family protein n=1 Tax=Brevundimonas fluminis TaxID=2487274 RepID=UPI000F657013|nr:hypothetical protein [Brevundimonas fluminis]